ncbi:hypothetical protein PENSPDRAFT_671944 [Peniophora sp. CONT]|nr:hypothetical protein PENSPDRAFT_671944 [Peniophora sp. CONT]
MSFLGNILRSAAAELGIEPRGKSLVEEPDNLQTPKPKNKGKGRAKNSTNAANVSRRHHESVEVEGRYKEQDDPLFGSGSEFLPDSPTMRASGLRGEPSNIRKTPEPSPAQGNTANNPRPDASKTSAPGTSGTSAQGTYSQKQEQRGAGAQERVDDMVPSDVLETIKEVTSGSSSTQDRREPAPQPSPERLGETLAQIRAEANRAASSSAEIAANRLATQFAAQAEAAAQNAANRVAHEVMEHLKTHQASNESHSNKRAEPPSPVDPTKARETARVVKSRLAETKKLQDLLHKRVEGYWEDKGELGPPVPAILAQRVRASYRDATHIMPPRRKALFRFSNLDMLGNDFKIADLAVDTSTGPKSDGGWNLFMAQYFAADFVKAHNQWTVHEVESAFFVWLQGLREKRLAGARRLEKATALNTTASEVKKQEDAEHAAAQVRSTLYFHRVAAADRIPEHIDPERYLKKLVVALDKDGMSDNEVEVTEQNVRLNFRTRPHWRAPAARVHMSNLDAIGDGMRLAHPQNHGGRPQPRLLDASRQPRVNTKSKPVPGLWRNIYDQDWLAQQPEEWVKYQLCPRDEDFPSQFDASLVESVHPVLPGLRDIAIHVGDQTSVMAQAKLADKKINRVAGRGGALRSGLRSRLHGKGRLWTRA